MFVAVGDVLVLAELIDGPTPSAETLTQLALLIQSEARPVNTANLRSQPAFAADVY